MKKHIQAAIENGDIAVLQQYILDLEAQLQDVLDSRSTALVLVGWPNVVLCSKEPLERVEKWLHDDI